MLFFPRRLLQQLIYIIRFFFFVVFGYFCVIGNHFNPYFIAPLIEKCRLLVEVNAKSHHFQQNSYPQQISVFKRLYGDFQGIGGLELKWSELWWLATAKALKTNYAFSLLGACDSAEKWVGCCSLKCATEFKDQLIRSSQVVGGRSRRCCKKPIKYCWHWKEINLLSVRPFF